MSIKIFRPRKQRTRQHVIADLSVHHVQGYILEAGYTSQKFESDYGYDLSLTTFDEEGYIEPDVVFIQLKAAEVWELAEAGCPFDLEMRDYNLWTQERTPVILVLYDATRKCGYWLHVQGHFRSADARQPQAGASTVRVHLPFTQVVSKDAVATWRELKLQARQQPGGAP